MTAPPLLRARRPALRLAAFFVFALLFAAEPAYAQYFGRNKVRYDDFDFRVLETEHFDIYYYPAEEAAVRDAARMAERWYERLSNILGHEFDERKSIIFYADDADFRQTNVVSGFIGEGTGGITEGLKQRIVMPLAETYADTDHVLGHELVHQFQYDMSRRGGQFANFVRLPLWIVEGFAEYLSVGREDTHTAMWLRDAVLRDNFPTLRQLSQDPRFFPYRYGQAFWAYVGGRFGDAAAVELFKYSLDIPVDSAIVAITGLDPDTLSAQWAQSIRDAYLPLAEGRDAPALVQEALAERRSGDPREHPTAASRAVLDSVAARLGTQPARAVLARSLDGGDINIAPQLSPDGRYVAFLSERDLFGIDLYLADANTGTVIKKLEEVSTSQHFDALRFINSAGTWSPDGEKFAYVVFAQGDNEIALLDVETREVDRRIRVEGIGALKDPSWSPDGRGIVFSGIQGGIADLYVVDVADGTVRQLTNDRYADIQPTWSPDGSTIAFSTDRGPGTSFQDLVFARPRLALYDTQSGQIRTLELFADAKHINPVFSPDGESLFFVADPDGFSNVYRYDLGTEAIYQVTNLATGVSGISALSPTLTVAQQTGRLMYAVFEAQNYNVYTLEPSETAGSLVTPGDEASGTRIAGLTRDEAARTLPPLAAVSRSAIEDYLADASSGLPDSTSFPSEDHRPRLRLDYISQPSVGVGYDPYFAGGFGLNGGISFLFSDQLSDRLLGVAVQAQGSLKDIGGQAIYLDRTRRLNWGGEVGRIPILQVGYFPVRLNNGQIFYLRQFQRTTYTTASALAQYPFSQTRRLEGSAGYQMIGFDLEQEAIVAGQLVRQDDNRFDGVFRTLHLAKAGIAYVGDYSLGGFTSPVRGGRYRLGVDGTAGSLNFATVTADYRRYLFTAPFFTFAGRALHYGRYGPDAGNYRNAPIYLGSQSLIRGYDYGTFTSGAAFTSVQDRLFGSSVGIVNLEARMPLLGVEGFGLFNFPYVPTELIAFFDAGASWGRFEYLQGVDPATLTPVLETFGNDFDAVDPVYSAGVGARINLLGAIILQGYYAIPFSHPEHGRSITDGVFGLSFSSGF